MAGRHQAWCARCDELRAARPGAACPVCGRRLLPVPAARTAEPRHGPTSRAAARLAASLPALRAASTGLVVLAVVAGAFAAGRVTRSTPSTPSATVPAFAEAGPQAGHREYGWRAGPVAGVTVALDAIDVQAASSQIELNVTGLAADEAVATVHGLRIQDAAGGDLVAPALLADLSPVGGQRLRGALGVDTDLPVAAALDWKQVARVSVAGLTVSRLVSAQLRGAILDRDLRRRTDQQPQEADRLASACGSCRLQVACGACRTVRLVGSDYPRPAVVLVVAPRGPPASSAAGAAGEAKVTAVPDGSELISWRDTAPDGTTAIGFDARELARDSAKGAARMRFSVELTADATRELRGPWTITPPGSRP
jgi:hypothetical protein